MMFLKAEEVLTFEVLLPQLLLNLDINILAFIPDSRFTCALLCFRDIKLHQVNIRWPGVSRASSLRKPHSSSYYSNNKHFLWGQGVCRSGWGCARSQTSWSHSRSSTEVIYKGVDLKNRLLEHRNFLFSSKTEIHTDRHQEVRGII